MTEPSMVNAVEGVLTAERLTVAPSRTISVPVSLSVKLSTDRGAVEVTV